MHPTHTHAHAHTETHKLYMCSCCTLYHATEAFTASVCNSECIKHRSLIIFSWASLRAMPLRTYSRLFVVAAAPSGASVSHTSYAQDSRDSFISLGIMLWRFQRFFYLTHGVGVCLGLAQRSIDTASCRAHDRIETLGRYVCDQS